MFGLVENSRRKLGKARCIMDEVIKRSALLESRGRTLSSHHETIDETFAYIVGTCERFPRLRMFALTVLSMAQVAMRRRRTSPSRL